MRLVRMYVSIVLTFVYLHTLYDPLNNLFLNKNGMKINCLRRFFKLDKCLTVFSFYAPWAMLRNFTNSLAGKGELFELLLQFPYLWRMTIVIVYRLENCGNLQMLLKMNWMQKQWNRPLSCTLRNMRKILYFFLFFVFVVVVVVVCKLKLLHTSFGDATRCRRSRRSSTGRDREREWQREGQTQRPRHSLNPGTASGTGVRLE